MSQSSDLHRALLRPCIAQTLRAAGFHSTRPAVLETLTNLTERYLLLLASTTARYASLSHNDSVPTVTDVRLAMAECGVLLPAEGAAEEEWREIMRMPVEVMGRSVKEGGEARMRGEKRKREEQDLRDVVAFTKWFDGAQHAEMRRVAGLVPDTSTLVGGAGAALGLVVGVGGGVVQAEDFLRGLKKKGGKAGDDVRWFGTVLGEEGEGREVLVEGGPVLRVRDWRPKDDDVTGLVKDAPQDDALAAPEVVAGD
ncbi:hypothetical protein LTR86_005429 [Recurvomyces mirabilis]|nr:hypothetical protein LTR86_005429 [Recurvomyces mirabilis]